MSHSPSNQKRHLLTVLLEDYFHVGAFNGLIEREKWYRFEPRSEKNTLRALDLLDRFQIKATFFLLGWIAERQPDLVREVARRGHEIGSRGFYHRSLRQMSSDEFRNDLARSRDALEQAGGKKVVGFRAARRLTLPTDAWALDVLAKEGYAYDSSVLPTYRSLQVDPTLRFAHPFHTVNGPLWEFPVATWPVLGLPLPILGGNYSRQLPHTFTRKLVSRWDQEFDHPFVLYFHVWELDPDQPRISGASPLTRVRHYRGLEKMGRLLEEYFAEYNFSPIADYLNLELTTSREKTAELFAPASQARSLTTNAEPAHVPAKIPRCGVTLIVPCYNEESVLPYLRNTLDSVRELLKERYDLSFIFVDDCSTDQTRTKLEDLFGAQEDCRIISQERNQGVAGAILTGIRNASTEVVCSIDCDCTYDPHELGKMIPRLTAGVALVTASPYHPFGQVRNVPEWRLRLSRTSSWLYRRVLRQKLFTYTSCFRVYKRSAVVEIKPTEGGFLGIAELLGLMDLAGLRIVEHPATLEVRLFGHSKMKTLKMIAGHLRLLSRFVVKRLQSQVTDWQPSGHSERVSRGKSRQGFN